METIVTRTVICEPKEVDNVIRIMLSEGWRKDTNIHELTMAGKVKFEMWRKMEQCMVCIDCRESPATHGIGNIKALCRNCWNKLLIP